MGKIILNFPDHLIVSVYISNKLLHSSGEFVNKKKLNKLLNKIKKKNQVVG